MTLAGAAHLLERERELTELEAVLDTAAAGAGGMALIAGPAGIGKSRLLAETRRLATESGVPFLAARAGELERDFPYGVVRQLFEGLLASPEDREAALAGAAAPAAAVFETVPGETADEGAGFATLHALYWLALNLAAEKPLLIEVDDIQWCDRPSLRYLAYLVRRLEGVPILVAATQRTAEAGTDPQLLDELAHDPLTRSISPAPLSADAVEAIVTERFEPQPAPEFIDACSEATGGNPLLLRELLNALGTDGIAPDAAGAAAIGTVGPRAVSRSVVLRLSRLDDDARATARAVAILGEGANLREIAGLARLTEPAVADASRDLVRAEILRPGATLGFVHPLVLDAVLGEMSSGEREIEHGRAAAALMDAGERPDRIATHLLMTSPRGDPEVVALLQEAGRLAIRKGAADSAAAYLRRALDEGPPPGDLPGVELELGLSEALSVGPPAAIHLQNAYDTHPDQASRALAAHILTRILMLTGDRPEAARLTRRVIDDLPPELEDTRKAFEAFEYTTSLFGVNPPSMLSGVRVYQELPVPDGPGAKMLAAASTLDWIISGRPSADGCAELALASLESGEILAIDNGFSNMAPITALTLADREESMHHWDLSFADAHRKGSLFAIAGLNTWLGFTHLWRGDLAAAEETLRSSLDEFNRWGMDPSINCHGAGFLAETMRERGDVGAGWKAMELTPDPGDDSDGARYLLNARMGLLADEGRSEEAIAAADEFSERFTHYVNPGAARWRMRKGLALHRLGRTGEAIELLEQEAELARPWGAPGTVGPSLRVLGTLKGADGTEHIEEAIAMLDGSTAQLELAKALAALGTALRLERKPTEAREPLGRALELAAKCSADGLAEHVRTELHATGARPRREALSGVGSLTPSERRVASLATEGMTNREIAQNLYVTPKTVEVHLSNAYRKLDIRSRRDLAGALAPA